MEAYYGSLILKPIIEAYYEKIRGKIFEDKLFPENKKFFENFICEKNFGERNFLNNI